MLTGCVEEYEADLPESETNLLVVNGTIRSNEKSEFYITRSVPLNDHQELPSVVPMVLNTNAQYRILAITVVTLLRWIQTYHTM